MEESTDFTKTKGMAKLPNKYWQTNSIQISKIELQRTTSTNLSTVQTLERHGTGAEVEEMSTVQRRL